MRSVNIELELEQFLTNQVITEQKEILDHLKELQIEISQPSLSRKLKDMGVTKVNGRYILPHQKVLRLHRWALSVETVPPNLLFLRTPHGYGRALAQAIDERREVYEGVVGTVSSEDTLLVVVSSPERLGPLRTEILEDFS